MKTWKVVAVSLVIVILVASSACSGGQKAAAQTQTVIAKGDIAVKMNGTGKTSYATDAKLAFDTVGKIEKLSIKEGDRVAKGTTLAKLETGNLELALSQAKVAVAQSQKALNQAGIGVSQTEIALTQAQISLSQAQSAKTAAEASLTAAQFNLDTIKSVGDVKDKIMKLQMLISAAEVNRKQANASGNTADINYLNQYLIELNSELDKRKIDLQKLLIKDAYANVAAYEVMIYDPFAQTYTLGGQTYDRLIVEDIQLKQQQVAIAQKGVEQAQQNIDQANQNINLAKQNIELSKQSVEQAKLTLEQANKAVEVAQKQLDNATIIAPFNGVAAKVDIKQGDYILTPGLSTGTPIYFVDPNSLEISVEIDEIDVANVQVKQPAVIKLDALPNTIFNGTVTSISITPKVKAQNSGVVVYEVKVGFNSVPSAQVKSGMSASVDIITVEKKGILLVPNKAIKQNAQGQKVVDVVVNQKTKEQPVEVGLTDGTQTEVISGINEGDIVIKQP